MKIVLKYLVFWVLASAILLGLGEASMSLSAMDISYQKSVKDHCRFAPYPTLCVETLMGSGSGHKLHIDMIYALLNKTISKTKLPVHDLPMFVSQFGVQHAQRAQSVTEYCETLMSMSSKRLRQSLEALIESPRKKKQDIQTWLSAALTFQEACKDSATGLSLPGDLMTQISQKISYLSQLTSNPLAFVNRITGKPKNTNNNKNTTSTRRLAEDDHDRDEKQKGIFPKWVSPRDRRLLQATTTTIKANAVVAKDGSGNYATVSEAMQAASGGRFVIYVKKGVYKEKVHTQKDGITLIGDGKYETIIVGDDSVAGGSSMPGSATFSKYSDFPTFAIAVTGDGFIARDIGFQNTAGPEGEQALALYIASDHSVVYRCSIIGYQDTLYALALRQFYRECDIFGTIDFIFGNAAAVFQNCFLVLRRPRGDSYNVILANGRSDHGQNTGFSLQNCKITVGSDFSPVKHSYNSYLGRPWKEYSRSVVMESTIDDAIAPRGWIEWPGTGKSSLETLYFAEYANTGPGAGISKRVAWPGFQVIGTEEADRFTVRNFIAGASWLPSTGVTFISGLQ